MGTAGKGGRRLPATADMGEHPIAHGAANGVEPDEAWILQGLSGGEGAIIQGGRVSLCTDRFLDVAPAWVGGMEA